MEIKYFETKNISLKKLSHEFINIIPNDILSCLGKKFILEAYLNEFKKSPKSTIIIAKDGSKIVGFILACDSSNLLKRVVFNNKINFIKSLIIFIFIRKFNAIKKIISVMRYIFSKKCYYRPKLGIELCYIGINQRYQKKGIGSMLINKLHSIFLHDKSVNKIYVKTLISGNDRAASYFYIKNYFKSVFICQDRNFLKRSVK